MLLATDLDRTLLPNGKDKDDGSLPFLIDLVEKNKIILVYVSGRDLKLLNEAIEKYSIPLPDYFISDVGATIYYKKNNELFLDQTWRKEILRNNPVWNRDKVEKAVCGDRRIFIQESTKQSEFKVSFYARESVDFGREEITDFVLKKVKKIGVVASVIYSFDPIVGLGLVDILPKTVSKVSAVDFLRNKLGLENNQIFYAGDSGNDILPLIGPWRSIVVKNASEKIKAEVLVQKTKNNSLESLYIAKGIGNLNGNYASGIIEGLKHFGLVK